MTEKEYRVARSKNDVAEAESRLREAERNLREGVKQGQLKMEQARSESEKDCARLAEEVSRCKSKLDTERKWLEHVEAELARGYSA